MGKWVLLQFGLSVVLVSEALAYKQKGGDLDEVGTVKSLDRESGFVSNLRDHLLFPVHALED